MRVRAVLFWAITLAALLGGLAITVARLTQPDGRLGIALVAFTPLAIPLYAVALLLAALRMVVRRRVRGAAAVVAVVAAVGIGLHGWWCAPLVTGSVPAAADDATPVVVMTANLRLGEADGVAVVRAAVAEDVDLLVLEEVTPAVLADMERAGLDDLLPHRAGEPGASATGTMAFARTELADVVRLPTSLASWGFTMGDLRVYGVHPTYPVDADGWAADHERLRGAIAEGAPDLVLGDLNATLDHAPLRRLVDDGYRDAAELANDGWAPTWPAGGGYDLLRTPLAQIDHVLVGPALTSLGTHTVAIPDSDHRAVVATVAAR